MALTAGMKLGPYEILAPLGAGGMGEVYRARDTRLERDVAVKVLPSDLSSDPNLRLRLEREAKAVSKLSHPHICTLHDIGHQDGVDFIVMELVEGETLEQRLLKGSLPPAQTMCVAAQVADALGKGPQARICASRPQARQRHVDEGAAPN
ncbi:MAG: serine/threonine protein kinase [Acidobacteriia bacterium]|nr:serine/threonine protein kinase [Terriglobia bacterium]